MRDSFVLGVGRRFFSKFVFFYWEGLVSFVFCLGEVLSCC